MGRPVAPRHLRPKPEAGNDYCGPFDKPIATNVDGIRIGELLPLLAKQADKYSIIRSMTHGINGHETAAYMVQTGRPPGGRDGLSRASARWSRCSRATTPAIKGLIPPYIVLTEPQGRFSEAGFPGLALQALRHRRRSRRRRRSPWKASSRRASPTSGSRTAANCCTSSTRWSTPCRTTRSWRPRSSAEKQAYDLILGDAGKVFDLSQEKDELRDRYGRNTFGQSCLVARRLVERGVPYVTINYKGWDTHKQHFQTMRRKLPEMDKGMATLLQDLADRGLLDSTIVWWSGEFGRTPKVQWEAALERRTRPLRQGLLRRGRRRRIQGRPRRRRLGRQRRRGQGAAGLSRAT